MRNALGPRGEAIFYTLMTEFHSDAGPIFRPQFLGEKWPSVDYLVELAGVDDVVPYFFVQVKTTRLGYTRRDRRLRVAVSDRDMRRLAAFPAPTYIAGIDEREEVGFLLSGNGEHLESLFSIPSSFAITHETRARLWEEVLAYWRRRAGLGFSSSFVDPSWR
jgi:hypothetical protein